VSGVRVPPPLPSIVRGRPRLSRVTRLPVEIARELSRDARCCPLASAEIVGISVGIRYGESGGRYQCAPLSDIACRNAKPREKPSKLSDGEGMHLLVQPNGSRLWRLSYRYGGKQKTTGNTSRSRRLTIRSEWGTTHLASSFAFVYPAVGLALARERRAGARRLLAAGCDPGIAIKTARRIGGFTDDPTFEAVAREWHKNDSGGTVSSQPEPIEQAKEEWALGDFDTVPGDAEEFIPLPKHRTSPAARSAAFSIRDQARRPGSARTRPELICTRLDI
jgi:hypothetical protein